MTVDRLRAVHVTRPGQADQGEGPRLVLDVSTLVQRAAIRPTGIRLRPPGAGIPGRLERRRFLGVVDMFEVAVNGIDRWLKGRTRESIAFSAKDEIALEIDPAEVLVFAAPEA